MNVSTPGLMAGQFHGIPAWLIENPHARAAVSMQGGQLLSFVPAGFEDLLWLSDLTTHGSQAIRGGVPVCWPYFARQGQAADVPQHGHARLQTWQLSDASMQANGSTCLQLELPASEHSPLRLRQRLLVGRQLQQQLTTRNPGDKTVALTQALHSYFAVSDIAQVRVSGVAGLEYADNHDKAMHTQAGDWTLADPRDPGRSDRIYARTGAHFELLDSLAGRRITVETEGSRSVVIWNPGQAGAQAMADVANDGWQQFVCIEAANAGADIIHLPPGQSHVLGQRLSVNPLDR